MAYSLKKIAAAYDRPLTTTYYHIKDLIDRKLFVKKSPGKQYNDNELKQLEKLMDFKYREQE
jgi:hypothetical protein